MIRKAVIVLLILVAAGIVPLWIASHSRLIVRAFQPTQRALALVKLSEGQAVIIGLTASSPIDLTLTPTLVNTNHSYQVMILDHQTNRPVGGFYFTTTAQLRTARAYRAFYIDRFPTFAPPVRRAIRVQAPLWCVALLLLAYPSAALTHTLWRRSRRSGAGLCLNCGYNLTGNTSGICPECGMSVHRMSEPATHAMPTVPANPPPALPRGLHCERCGALANVHLCNVVQSASDPARTIMTESHLCERCARASGALPATFH